MKKQDPVKLKYLFKVSHLENREARMKTSSDFGIWVLKFYTVFIINLNAAFWPLSSSIFSTNIYQVTPVCWAVGSVLRVQG